VNIRTRDEGIQRVFLLDAFTPFAYRTNVVRLGHSLIVTVPADTQWQTERHLQEREDQNKQFEAERERYISEYGVQGRNGEFFTLAY
jgi:hypothetical protein